MTRTFSMGVTLSSFIPGTAQANSYTDTQLLGFVDDWKNALADQLGLAHTDVASAHLYPSSITIGLDLIGTFTAGTPAPIGMDFPGDTLMDGLRDRGIRAMFFIEPTGVGAVGWGIWSNWPLGTFNAWLDRFAKKAKQWANNANSTGLDRQGNVKDSNIIFRLAQEMNANWFPWCIGKNGNTAKTFKAAWRYIHERLLTYNGAKNIRMFYCPHGIGGGSVSNLYPGDAYTYYVGIDLHRGPYNQMAIKSMRDMFSPFYYELMGGGTNPATGKPWLGVAKTKSMIIGETSVGGGYGDANRAAWIDGSDDFGGNAGGYQWIYDNLPKMRGVTYFDINAAVLDQGPNATILAYATAADAISSPYTPEHAIRPYRDTWIMHPIGGTKNYGNAATEKITIGPSLSSDGTKTYKGRGLFGYSPAQMTNLLGLVPEFFTADLTFTVANEECATRGSDPYFFLEVLSGSFDSLLADANGNVLDNCDIQAAPKKPKAVWPGPSAQKTNRIFVDASTVTTGDEIVIDLTDILQDRVDREDTSGLYFRLIACDDTGTTYDEANTARTISIHSSKSEGNEPVLKVRLAVGAPDAVAMIDGLGLFDTMSVDSDAVFSVNGEYGVINFKLQNQTKKAVLADVDEDSVFIHTAFKIDKLPKGGNLIYRVIARYVDSSNYYDLRLVISPGGNIVIGLAKVVAGVETLLNTVDPSFNVIQNRRYFARFYADGTTPTFLSGKVWADGTVEPDPMVSVYDTQAALQVTGAVGIGGHVGTLTNLPLLLKTDEFWAAPF